MVRLRNEKCSKTRPKQRRSGGNSTSAHSGTISNCNVLIIIIYIHLITLHKLSEKKNDCVRLTCS